MLLSGSVHALQAMDDSDLRAINGQDGEQIATTFDETNVDTLYWTDQAGRGTVATTQKQELTATADKVKISEICKKYGITKPTFYRYKENYKL